MALFGFTACEAEKNVAEMFLNRPTCLFAVDDADCHVSQKWVPSGKACGLVDWQEMNKAVGDALGRLTMQWKKFQAACQH